MAENGISKMKLWQIISTLNIALTMSISANANNFTNGGTSLPYNIYMQALAEYPEYDPELDYTKLKTIALNTSNSAWYQPEIKKMLIDKVVVIKSRYRLFLYKGDTVVKSYTVGLGTAVGPKEFEGDKKTPEGEYFLDYKKYNSTYYKAFHISYPNAKDIENAKKQGKRPGGMIMLHGQPTYIKGNDGLANLQPSRWTNGCIALLNHDIDELLDMVDPGTPILIMP